MKNIIAVGVSVAVSLMSVTSYGEPYNLGGVNIKAGESGNINLYPLQDKFIYTVMCTITNPQHDEHIAIKVSQKYNDFGNVTLDGEPLNKNNARETVQGVIKQFGSIIVIDNVNDNSGTFKNDYLIFDRAASGSTDAINVSCTAEAPHNPPPPAPPAFSGSLLKD